LLFRLGATLWVMVFTGSSHSFTTPYTLVLLCIRNLTIAVYSRLLYRIRSFCFVCEIGLEWRRIHYDTRLLGGRVTSAIRVRVSCSSRRADDMHASTGDKVMGWGINTGITRGQPICKLEKEEEALYRYIPTNCS
jgi:hypothetical protein